MKNTSIVKLNSSLHTINTIVHIADVHVRLYKRHQEYKSCFDTLKKKLSIKYGGRNDVLIVVAGDVNHAKTDMSPEMIQLSSQLLSDLSDIAPTVVIAGNHDLNLANQARLDSLTPIVENLNRNNLFYLRESGIYNIADVDFSVFSIIGDRTAWPLATESTASKKIALYHGPVQKAQTDGGYTISSHHVTTLEFDGYDLALLGDIHKMQILQYRDATIKKPTVAYCGSLIQQNHGESLDGHGWLEWNLNDYDFEFHPLINAYGYLTINVVDGNWTLPPKFPVNSRIRLFVSNTDATQIKKLSALLRKKTNVTELTVNRLSDAKLGADHTSVVQQDVHDVVYQNELISSYIKHTFPSTDQELLDRVTKLNVELNTKLGDDDLPHNVVWRPLNLKFDNLFSYGEGNEIQFESMTGLYGVFSPNATGKTSAFDALCFALYDKTPRAFKGSHIMNTRCDDCSCELLLDINGTTYKIVRVGERRKNGEVKVDVEFGRFTSTGEYVNLSGEDRRATNAIIRSYVGEYEDFILTSLSVQNQNSLFIDLGQSDRKDLLGQFMGLTIFDRLFDVASAEIKEISGALKRFNKEDFTQELVDIQEKLDESTTSYDDLTLDVSRLKLTLTQLNNRITNEYSKKIPLIGVSTNRDDLELQLNLLDESINQLQARAIRLNEKRASMYELIQTTKNSMPDEDRIAAGVSEKLRLADERAHLMSEYLQQKSRVESMENKIHWLATHEYDPDCKYCVGNTMVQEAMDDEVNVLHEQCVLAALETKKNKLDSDINTLGSLETEERKLREDQRLIARTNADILAITSDMETVANEMVKQKEKHQLVSRAIEQYDLNAAAIQTNNQIGIVIHILESERNVLTKKIDELNKQLQINHGRMEVLKSQKTTMMQKITEAEELETTYEAYELYMSSICRDGIPYHLMSKVIPFVQTTTNNILTQVVDFTIALDVDGKNINGKIVYDDTKSWPLELASGMEKFVSSLAIRIALMRISSLPRSNFLIIDEGLGVLDSDNLSSMFMLFDVLKSEFDFLILISHLDITRDIADNLIEIRRDNGFSYINKVS